MDQNHAITIDLVKVMKVEMKNSPKVLPKFYGKESCCIFKVPESLLEINKEAYEPQIVSIGPYHHGKDLQMIKEFKWRYLDDLLKYMPGKTTDESLKSLLDSIVSVENEIRQSYSESIEYISRNDLAKMMVLDGVFLIELFRKFWKLIKNDPIFKMVWVLPFLMRDFLKIENQIPFFVLQTLFDASQTKTYDPKLPSLILYFFNYAADRPKEVLSNDVDLHGKHLLDFFRNGFIEKPNASIRNGTRGHVVDPPSLVDRTSQQLSEGACLKETVVFTGNETSGNDTSIECIPPAKMHLKETVVLTGDEMSHDDTSIEHIQPVKMLFEETSVLTANETSDDDISIITCYSEEMVHGIRACGARIGNPASDNPSIERIQPATKLVVAGVKFKKNHKAESFLDIKFQNGVLLIPEINLDDFYTCFILNGMIFEQCYTDCSKDITTYIMFLGCLINTSMDVRLLSESKIIQNYLGTDKELVKFFNNVGKYVAYNIKDNYLKSVFKEINEYCDSGWHVGWAGFKHTYFDSPWTFISAFAAFVLLCLTVLQTFYTVYPYYYEHKQNGLAVQRGAMVAVAAADW